MDRLVLSLVNYVTNEYKTTFTAIGGFAVGNMAAANTILQHLAFIFTILVAILTIVNLFFPLRIFYTQYRNRHHIKMLALESMAARMAACEGICDYCPADLQLYCTQQNKIYNKQKL